MHIDEIIFLTSLTCSCYPSLHLEKQFIVLFQKQSIPSTLNLTKVEWTTVQGNKMSETPGPFSDITEEAARVIDAAQIGGFPLRLLGDLAIYFQYPATKSDQRLSRVYKVLDVVTPNKWDAKRNTPIVLDVKSTVKL